MGLFQKLLDADQGFMNSKIETALPKQLYKQFFFVAFGVFLAAELVFYVLGDGAFKLSNAASGSEEASQVPPYLLLLKDMLWMAAKGIVVGGGLVWILHRMIGRYLSALLLANRRTRKNQLVHAKGLNLPNHEIADLFLAREKMLFEIEEHQFATDRKLREVEDNLIRAAKLTATGELTSTIIHDLRNPLTAILGYADLLEESALDESGTLDPSSLDKVRRIKRAATHIQSLVSRMSSFARTGLELDLQDNVSLRDCVMETEMFLEHHFKIKKVNFRKKLSQADLRCWGSKQLIVQILVNLCVNAVDAMDEMSAQTERVIELSIAEQESELAIMIADSGPGIPEEILPEIFKPFFTTKGEGKGTGMGLASCMDIAELLHTKITVTNKTIGHGAVFCFTLHKANPVQSRESAA
jgi:C4-dicarboxylate-specific signal transduction histidine kinase